MSGVNCETFCACCTSAGRATVAVALWTAQPSGNVIPLCESCLNSWRTNAEDDPELRPRDLRFLGHAE